MGFPIGIRKHTTWFPEEPSTRFAEMGIQQGGYDPLPDLARLQDLQQIRIATPETGILLG